MKPWGALIAVAGLAAAFAPPMQSQKKPVELPWTLVVSGQTEGYLSPCGCTYPMTGGIRRRATAVSQVAKTNRVVLIDTGNFTDRTGRQSEMKAETVAQALRSMGAAAIALTAQDARLGQGPLSSMVRLAEGRFVSTDLVAGQLDGVTPFAEQGPFLIGSTSPGLTTVLSASRNDPSASADLLNSQALRRRKTPVLMFDGPHDAAKALAAKFPAGGVIVYRRSGWPTDLPETVGKVWLVTPGERGKAIVRLSLTKGRLGTYSVTRLGPEFGDDKNVDRLFRTYLQRVEAKDFLANIPRAPSDPFAGSSACAKCHTGADKVWRASGHAHALATLEKVGQDRDPDCVSCHVTGLTRDGGFTSRTDTPDFSFVGCESCHGPGKAHSLNPKEVRLPKVGAASCVTCHTRDQSPQFTFLTYWRKIAHK